MILDAVPAAKFEIIREMTERDNNLLKITWLCEIAGVTRGGYYYWLNAEETRERLELQDQADFEIIVIAFQFRGYAKGARGIHMRLLHLTPPVRMNVKKIRRLMDKYHLECPIRRASPYRQMAIALRESKVAPNLLNREFRIHGPRTVLLTDITYIPRGEGLFSYLSVIMDACTKQVLAHVTSVSLEVDFVLLTVELLMAKHGATLKTDTLIHSDQGTHYTSHKFIEIIRSAELRQSMSRRGNCWDNAPQENLFSHMKEEIYLNPSDKHCDIAKKIDDWVDYYNNDRYQWNLAKLSPNEYYQWITTGIYPLGGAAPDPPEFSAFVSGEGEITDERSEANDVD
jgi:transposase InsO family protein